MAGRRGLVVDLQGDHAVLLTRDGEFVLVRPKSPVSLGSEVPVPRPFPARALAQVAALLLVMLMASWWWYQVRLGPVVAYVSLDINPSLELGVDARWRVVEARGLNPVGAELIALVAHRGRQVDAVVAEVTARAGQRPVEPVVLVTVTAAAVGPVPPGLSDRVLQAARGRATPGAVVQVVEVDPELRARGRQLGLSTGRAALALAAHRRGAAVDMEAMKEESLERAASRHGFKLKDLVEAVAGERDWRPRDEFGPPSGERPDPSDEDEEDRGRRERPGRGDDRPPGRPQRQPGEPPSIPGRPDGELPGPPRVGRPGGDETPRAPGERPGQQPGPPPGRPDAEIPEGERGPARERGLHPGRQDRERDTPEVPEGGRTGEPGEPGGEDEPGAPGRRRGQGRENGESRRRERPSP
jgi:hypothetical protein